MASGARVGKIYRLDEADVSCLDLFIMLLCLFCHSRLIIILWAWSFGQVQGKEELLLGRQQNSCLDLNWCAAGHQLIEASGVALVPGDLVHSVSGFIGATN